MYVNEMQRSINGGFGHAGRGLATTVIPYGHFEPYRPSAITRGVSFGDVPNDFEASVDLQYIPVRQGWYHGAPVDGRGYPDGGGFGTAMDVRPDGTAYWNRYGGSAMGDADPAMRIAKYEKMQTIMQAVSTFSIATIACLAIAKAVVTIKRREFGRSY